MTLAPSINSIIDFFTVNCTEEMKIKEMRLGKTHFKKKYFSSKSITNATDDHQFKKPMIPISHVPRYLPALIYLNLRLNYICKDRRRGTPDSKVPNLMFK